MADKFESTNFHLSRLNAHLPQPSPDTVVTQGNTSSLAPFINRNTLRNLPAALNLNLHKLQNHNLIISPSLSSSTPTNSNQAQIPFDPSEINIDLNWLADQRTRSKKANNLPITSPSSTTVVNYSNTKSTMNGHAEASSSKPKIGLPLPLLNPPNPRSSNYPVSPCFVHSHLDQISTARPRNLNNASLSGEEGEGDEFIKLLETAGSVREMSKNLGRARLISHIQSVMIVTKARDNQLISLTRELALYLMQTPRNGKDRGLVIYVDSQLKKSKRFDAEGLERDHPELFEKIKPSPRRYSRNSSFVSLVNDPLAPLSQSGGESSNKEGENEGQLRYWTNEMCTISPHLFDFVVTLGGDGTVLYSSWLFQSVVPPIIPFSLGSLGFLCNFDFASYQNTLTNAIDNGILVNLRMRFSCTVFRAIEAPTGEKRRRAVRNGRTGGIFMSSLTEDCWEAIESGANTPTGTSDEGGRRPRGKEKEIKCFSTRAAESFEVLNDLVVDRGPSPYISLLELFSDEQHLTTVQADGLIIATPTGSTAYSLSSGGSLVHPQIPSISITPICPHTLSFRPMLLPDSVELRICVPRNSRASAWASFDGRGRVELKQGDHIKVTASPYPFPTVCADKQSSDWFNSISRTLKWNEREKQKSFVILEEGRKKSRESSEGDKYSTGNSITSNYVENESEGDDDDTGESDEEESSEEGEASEEEFDIDDKSPVVPAFDPETTNDIPPLTNSQAVVPNSFRPPHTRETSSTASSVGDLESHLDRFIGSTIPKPPRLSQRHSSRDANFDNGYQSRSPPFSAPATYSSHRNSNSGRTNTSSSSGGDQVRKARIQEAVRAFAVVGIDDLDSDHES